MSVDRESTSSGSGEVYIDQQEKITVKIADLGNGACLFPYYSVLLYYSRSRAASLAARVRFLDFAHTMSFKLYGIFHEGLPFRELALNSSGGRRRSLMSTVRGVVLDGDALRVYI